MIRLFASRLPASVGAGLLMLLLAAGCASPQAGVNLENLGENDIYNRAQLRMRSGNFIGATDLFQLLLRRYPFGRYAEQAQIELVYAYFMSFRVEEARTEAERFLRLYPQHQNADYARFIRAYSTFHRDAGIAARTFRLNYARRDVSKIRESFEELGEFLKLHPESPYAPLARRRMLQLKEMSAYHELWVADFYLKKGAFLAAVNRADWVLKHIPETSATPWALAVMSRAYRKMDLFDEADEALRILADNFPNHASLQDGALTQVLKLPNEERTITSILTLGLFDRPAEELPADSIPPPRPDERESTATETAPQLTP